MANKGRQGGGKSVPSPKPGGSGGSGSGSASAGSGATPVASASAGKSTSGSSRASGGSSAKSSAAGRKSVAAARQSTAKSNRTQLIIGIVAVVVITAIIAIGFILNRKQTAVQGEGYGSSTKSVATMADGVVTVTNGSDPKLTIDIYQDAMCPSCQAFEQQFGQQVNQAVDSGQLRVNYHMLNFLDSQSASKSYSTRAAAALLCVGSDSSAQPGAFMRFLENLYDDDVKPAEGGTSDLSDQQLADLASKNGATAAAATCITKGTNVALAKSGATAATNQLQAATGTVQTPTVLKDGQAVEVNSTSWLSDLLKAA